MKGVALDKISILPGCELVRFPPQTDVSGPALGLTQSPTVKISRCEADHHRVVPKVRTRTALYYFLSIASSNGAQLSRDMVIFSFIS
jgi:hypothetical protein